MTDKKISELTSITSAEIANDDEIVISDTSATHTKKAGIGELATFFGVNQEGIQDTVGAMFTGHSSHAGITPVYDDPNGHLIFSLAGGVTTAEMGFLAGTTSDIQTQFDAKAPLASPALTGNPTAPTQTADNNSTRLATTAYVQTELTNYASDNATFTNKGGAISQWTNDAGYITASSTDTFTNKSGNISQWTNNSNYLTPSSTNTLTNKSIDGASNPITNVPYTAISNIVDTDITSVSASDDELASSKAIKTYVDAQISGIDTIAEASDSNISSPSAGQILVHDGTDSFDNQTSTVTLSGAVTGTANMDSSGDFAITTTIPTNTITINGQAVALGGSATIPSVLQSGGTFTGELHLNDDVLLSFGGASGSGDFSISHESSTGNTILAEGGSGNLKILASNIEIRNANNSQHYLTANDGGDLILYKAGSERARTSTNGFNVTGDIAVTGTVDGVDVASLNTTVGNLATVATSGLYSDLSGSPTLATVATSGAYSDLSGTPTIPSAIGGATGVDFNDNVKARFGDDNDLEIYHDGANSFIKDVGTGGLYLRGDTVIALGVGSESAVRCTINGDVKLYYDDAEKLATNSGGVTVTGEVDATSFDGILASGISLESNGWHQTSDSKNRLYFADNSHTYFGTASKFFWQNTSGTNRFELDSSGNAIFSGNVTAYGSPSDITLKENIEVIPNALDKVSELRGVTFNYKKDGKKSTGLIAQELEKVLPEVVYDTHEIGNEDEQFKAVRYGNTVGLLVEAIKELKERNEKLELIVNRLITEVEEAE